MCGAPVIASHCKRICLRCGFMTGCSEGLLKENDDECDRRPGRITFADEETRGGADQGGGVGGGGGNATADDRVRAQGIEFIAVNTDLQALRQNKGR